MIHKEKRSLSRIARHFLFIPICACLLVNVACSQSSNVVKGYDYGTHDSTIIPVTQPDVMPSFPGGETALLTYISRNMIYPKSAIESGIQGMVNLRFVIDKDGTIKNFTVIRSVDRTCDEEAIRVVKNTPKWIPGIKNGENVPVYYYLPIRFSLNKPE